MGKRGRPPKLIRARRHEPTQNTCVGCGPTRNDEPSTLCARCYDVVRSWPNDLTRSEFFARVQRTSMEIIPSIANRDLVAQLALIRRAADVFIDIFNWTLAQHVSSNVGG